MSPSAPDRTNADWLRGLAAETRDEATVAALRDYLRRGLVRALSTRGRVSDSDLDDFAQNGTMQVLERLDRFRGESRFTTWAMAVAVHLAFDAMRKRDWGRRTLTDLDLSADGGSGSVAGALVGAGSNAPSPDGASDRDDLLSVLRRAIDRDLTPRQRTVILAELAGMPGSVLVEQLGTNHNALYKLHHDARRKLRAALESAGFDDAAVRAVFENAS